MPMEVLEQHYGITPDKTINDGRKIRYMVKDSLYTITQVTNMEQETLIELYEMSDHLAKFGDKKVSIFVPGNNQKYLVTHKDQDYVVLFNQYTQSSQRKNIGRQLARFHERGKFLQTSMTETSRLGKWKTFWAQRLDQMEKVWSGKVQEKPTEEFDRLFIESFPYYLGLCENAIQYVTDTELDQETDYSDRGTICHQRFHGQLWSGTPEIRDPFDWVFDHPARDIAEWIRDLYFHDSRSFQPAVSHFLQGYQSIAPISDFSWRLIYARLLFPLHYFSCVEEHYLTSSQSTQWQQEERLRRFMRDARDYELFLTHFYSIANVHHHGLPELEWLLHNK